MNILRIGRNAGAYADTDSRLVFAGNLTPLQNRGLKSTQEKAQRREKSDSQIGFWENQKQNLKGMECGSVEEIARKLEMYHSYEDEIAAARAAYNNEQMFHVLEEAKELGEKIAEYTEKLEPKTAEERKEEIAEEALGTEEKDGMLEEVLDEMSEVLEEVQEELLEEEALQEAEVQEEVSGTAEAETQEALSGAAKAEMQEAVSGAAKAEVQEEVSGTAEAETQKAAVSGTVEAQAAAAETALREWQKHYRPMDIRV